MFELHGRAPGEQGNALHFLRDGETVAATYRYEELDETIRGTAAFLHHVHGVRPGEHVLLLLNDPIRFTIAFLACQYIGAVPTGLSPNLNRHSVADRLTSIARHLRAVLIVTDTSRVPHAALTLVRERTGITVTAISEPLELAYPPVPRVDFPVAFIQYTSGSTQEPKGVVVSKAALAAQFDMLIRTFGFSARSTFVNWLPLHHDMGLVSKMLLPYHLGATCVHMLPAAFVQRPARWLRAIDRFGGTVSSAPNFAYELCLRIPSAELTDIDLSSWSSAVCGAEPVRAPTLRAFAKRFAPHGFNAQALCPAYGMAEATLLVTARRGVANDVPRVMGNADEFEALGALASCGEPLVNGLTIKVVDPATRLERAHGEAGEIWIAGPCIADGYLLEKGLDRSAFRHALASEDAKQIYFATGDLGYIGPTGLHVLGRVGSAITVAGRKYFFSDIEFAMTQVDTRFAMTTTAAFSLDGGRSLTLVYQLRGRAAAEADHTVLGAACASWIEAAFPIAVSNILFTTRLLPLTSSGKLQRDKVRDLYLSGGLPGVSIACGHTTDEPSDPHDARTRALETIAQELGISVDKVDLERTLPELGAESLAIARIQFAFERRLGCVVDRAAMYASLNVRALLDAAATAVEISGPTSRRSAQPFISQPTKLGDEPAFPATSYQRAVHFAEALANRSIYTLQRAVRLDGELNMVALEQALRALEVRHEALRGTLRTDQSGLSYVVDPVISPALVVEELSPSLGASSLEARMRKWVDRGMQPDARRLYRVVVLRIQEGASIFLLQIHHAIADFWSLLIIWCDLFDCYDEFVHDRPAKAELPCLSYAEHCVAHQTYLSSERARVDKAFWCALLSAHCDPRLPLLTQGVEQYGAGRISRHLPLELVRALRKTAAQAGTTVNCLMQLALQASLVALVRRKNIRYGVALLNRSSQYGGTVGMFANLVPFECEFNPGVEVTDALAALRAALVDAMAHEASPLAQLGVQAVMTGSTPGTCFDVVYAYFDLPLQTDESKWIDIATEREEARIHHAGLVMSPQEVAPSAVHYPLQIQVFSSGHGLDVKVDYRRDLLDEQLVMSCYAQFQHALYVLSSDSSARLGDALTLPSDSAARLRQWGMGADGEYTSMLAHILRTAKSNPDRVALVDEASASMWTYERLIAVASELARRTRQLHGSKAMPVIAVLMPRSPLGVAACLGVMLAGCVYLPIDPATPVARRDYMLQDSDACALIVAGEVSSDGISLPFIDAETCMLPQPSWVPQEHVVPGPDHPAYLIYTSGSTGRPKGVLVAHRALDNRMGWMIEHLALDSNDVFLQKTIWTFDVSLWEIFVPLMIGSKSVCLGHGQERFPDTVAAAIMAHGVSIAHFVPSVLMRWLDIDAARDALRMLRIAICSGERMLPAHAEAFFSCVLDARLFNFYGPTEAGIDITYAEVDSATCAITIGRPAPGCEISIIDDAGMPVLPGMTGELVVGGPQVAMAYVRQPVLTAASFVPSPLGTNSRCYRTGDMARFNARGAIVYLGRRDGQVKLSGYRIETGEVECSLASIPGVSDVVVMLHGDNESEGVQKLCAFLRMDGDLAPKRSELITHARRWLPEFMVPRRWLMLRSFPMLESGKVDRGALRGLLEQEGECSGDMAPTDGLSARLAARWREVLGGASPSDGDDFFSAGGDSILALRYIGRLREDGIVLSVEALFQHSTFGALRVWLGQSAAKASDVAQLAPFALVTEQEGVQLLAKEIEDAYPLSYLQRGILYQYFNDAHYEIFVTSLSLMARWDEGAMRRAIGHVMSEHAFLRSSIDLENHDEPLQRIHRNVTVPFTVADWRGVPAASLHAKQNDWIKNEKGRPFVWEDPPHCRFAVHLLDAEHFQLTFSDASLDGWCVATVLTELMAAYASYLEGCEPASTSCAMPSYREFVALEQQALACEAHRNFWTEVIRDVGFGKKTLPVHAPGASHDRLTWHGDAQLVECLERVADLAGVPFKSVLMSVHFAALTAISGVTLQTSGVEFNGRPELPGGERCVGVFNNLLPFSLELEGMSWFELMHACLDTERDYLPFRRFPYAELVAMNDGRPLFHTLFVYTHFHVYRGLDEAKIHVVDYHASDQTYVPVTVHFNRHHANGGLQILFDYDARRFNVTYMRRLVAAIAESLSRLCASDEALMDAAALSSLWTQSTSSSTF